MGVLLPRQASFKGQFYHLRAEAPPGQAAFIGDGGLDNYVSFGGRAFTKSLMNVFIGNGVHIVLMLRQAMFDDPGVFKRRLPGADTGTHPASKTDHAVVQVEDVLAGMPLLPD